MLPQTQLPLRQISPVTPTLSIFASILMQGFAGSTQALTTVTPRILTLTHAFGGLTWTADERYTLFEVVHAYRFVESRVFRDHFFSFRGHQPDTQAVDGP